MESKFRKKTKFILSCLMMLGVAAGIGAQHESVVKAEAVIVDDNVNIELITDVKDLLSTSIVYISSYSKDGTPTDFLGQYSGSYYYRTTQFSENKNLANDKGPATPLEITKGNEENTYAIKDGNNYFSYSGSANNLPTVTNLSNSSSWTIEISDSGEATVKNANSKTRYLQYNSSSPRFACYNNGSQNNLSFWKVAKPIPTITLSTDETDLYVGETSMVEALIENDDSRGELTWSQSSIDGGSLNIEDADEICEVTALTAGTVNLIASFTIGDAEYTSEKITFTITDAPVISWLNYNNALAVNESTDVEIVVSNVESFNDNDIQISGNDDDVVKIEKNSEHKFNIIGMKKGEVNLVFSIQIKDKTYSSEPLFIEVVEETYHVTFNIDGEEYLIQSATPGSLLTEPEFPQDKIPEGQVFDGWYKEGSSASWDFEKDTVDEDGLVLNAKFREKNAQEKLADLETMANLGFSYENSKQNTTIKINRTASKTQNDFDNNEEVKSEFNFDNAENAKFIESIKGQKNGTNFALGFNKNNTIRLYSDKTDGNGTSITFVTTIDIESVIVEFNQSNEGTCGILFGELTEENNVFEQMTSENEYFGSGNSFILKNIGKDGTQVYINSIIIKVASDTTVFSNVRARFTAHIDDEIYNKVNIVSAGVKVSILSSDQIMDIKVSKDNITAGENEHSFTVAVTNIPETAFNIEMTATAYVILESGETINLKSKTISVMGMVDRYLEEGNPFGLSEDDLALMQTFKQTYGA